MANHCLLAVVFVSACVPALGQVGARGGTPPAVVDHFSWSWQHRIPADPGFLRFGADAGLAQAQAATAPPLGPGDPAARPNSSEPIRRLSDEGDRASAAGRGSAARDFYRFAVKVENQGKTAIKSVVWDYIFRDPVSNAVVKVLRFRTDGKIKPGKTKVLEGYTFQPPLGTTSVALLKDGKGAHRGESVEIVRILFADDSVWSRRR